MQERFRGCMLGGLIGDCIGAHFEFVHGDLLVPRKDILAHIHSVKAQTGSQERYTDDTAMARQIAITFVEDKHLSTSSLARRFTEEYFREPGRGYGAAVREVFTKLQAQDQYKDPLKPAREQFNGSGSYGNGAGMRAHPIGMAMVNTPTAWKVEQLAEEVAKITHSHNLGVMGGCVQAVAVYHALRGATPGEVREHVESMVEDSWEYSTKMGIINRSLDRPLEELEEVILGHDEAVGLGNDVSAVDSVPTALYCVLKVLSETELELKTGNQLSVEAAQKLFEEVLILAIQCGGDTDTIASMACAQAGAHLGERALPPELVAGCEANVEMKKLADKMWEVIQEQKIEHEVTETEPKKPRL